MPKPVNAGPENQGIGGQLEQIYLENHLLLKNWKKGSIIWKTQNRIELMRYYTNKIKHFRHKTKIWLLDLCKNRRTTYQVPKKNGANPKRSPFSSRGKDPEVPSSYRVSVMPPMLYERLILDRIKDHLESKQIPQQAGFRRGRSHDCVWHH